MDKKELCKKYNEGQRFLFVTFWKSNDILSNWYPVNFTIDNVEYWCVEQYMMAEKARLFQDYNILKKIMFSNNQKEIKSLGRKIQNFNQGIWDLTKEDIVFKGNLAKFSQNPELKNKLLLTENYILVEASPYDKIWGVGLGSKDVRIFNPNYWEGLNLLGFVLMDVREQLKNNEKIKNEFLKELKENI